MKSISTYVVQKLIIITILLSFIILAFYMYYSRPELNPSDAPNTEFSAERAYQHLEVIAQQPRRLFQPYYNECRNYLVNELFKLGLDVQIQEGTAHHPSVSILYSSVENIITRIKGTSASQEAILLNGHFDSEPFVSPGAKDNGGSVAIMLEIARALKASERLKNDVILLFSSAHEPGNMGATAFITEHPWAEDVKLVINLEGAGNGKAIFLDVSQDNGWLIKEFSEAYQRSLSNSTIEYFEYRHTNFAEVFQPAGYPGFDIGNVFSIPGKNHARWDNLEEIQLKDLQEYGDTVYTLTKHFGNISLNRPEDGNHIFFSLLGIATIHYPNYVPKILIVVAILLFGFVLYLGFRKKILSITGIGMGFAACILSFLITVSLTSGIWYLISFLHPMYQYLYNGAFEYNSQLFYASFLIMAFIISYLSFYIVGKIRFLHHTDLVMGINTSLLVVSITTNIFLPGLEYFSI